MEEILAEIFEKTPEALIYLKEKILEAFGPAGLMIAVAALCGLAVYSVIKIVRFLFRLVVYIIIPALLVYIFIWMIDPSLLKSF